MAFPVFAFRGVGVGVDTFALIGGRFAFTLGVGVTEVLTLPLVLVLSPV